MEEISEDITFLHFPANIVIAGATSSGKTSLLLRILIDWPFQCGIANILYLYNVWQPLFEKFLEIFPNITFVQGLCLDKVENEWQKMDGCVNICIVDDMADEAVKSESFARLFTVYGHHRGIVNFFLTQNPYFKGRLSTTINRNTHYFILTKTPHLNVLDTLNTQLYGGNQGPIKHAYLRSMKEKPYNYLLIDVFCDDLRNRLRTNILKAEFPLIIWRPKFINNII